MPLGVVHSLKRVQPGLGRSGEAVKFDAVDEGCRGAGDALGSSILRDRARLIFRVVHIVGTVVQTQDGGVVETKLSRHLLGPVLDEVILGHRGQG